ncbi:MAG: hypothetical protein RR619_12505, partial [Raoultibacter sp.]
MKRTHLTQNVLSSALHMLLAVALVLGLAPAMANADTTVGVKVEAPAQVNKVVELGSDDGALAPDNVDSSLSEVVSPESAPDQINSAVPLDPDTTPKPSQITSDVTLSTTPDTQTEALLVDGLTYLVDHTSLSATLTG